MTRQAFQNVGDSVVIRGQSFTTLGAGTSSKFQTFQQFCTYSIFVEKFSYLIEK